MRRASKQMKAWNAMQNCSLLLFVVLFVIVFLLILNSNGNPHIFCSHPKLKWNSFQSVLFHPTVKFMNETEVIWQIPDSPKAVLFLAHGCNGRAADFWDRSSGCPNCIGLPEERLIALYALARKYAVLTISSDGRCWSFGKEKDKVKGIINVWTERNNLEKLPVTALGASSGGYFVSALANEMRFSSITLMISEGVFDSMDIPRNYPSTLFVHMPKDRVRDRLIRANMEALKNMGISVAEVRSFEFPLTPKLFSDRIPGLNETVSIKLYNLFLEKGFINRTGYMRNDGRAIHWKHSLTENRLFVGNFEWVKHVQEEMNLAFAYHEMTSLHCEQIFEWFESHSS